MLCSPLPRLKRGANLPGSQGSGTKLTKKKTFFRNKSDEGDWVCPGSTNSKLNAVYSVRTSLPSLIQGSSRRYSLPAKNWSLPPHPGWPMTPTCTALSRCVPADGTDTILRRVTFTRKTFPPRLSLTILPVTESRKQGLCWGLHSDHPRQHQNHGAFY